MPPYPKEYNDESDWMKVCVPHMMNDKGMENKQAVAACMNMWRNKDKAEESQTDFTFTELSGDLKAIDGLAAGKFTAMSGDEVEFSPDDLQAYIDNTNAIIESTRTEKGEVVGLPIDKNGHDHIGGAGWIVGLELDKARNVIRFLVNWTQEGIDLIKGNLRRFFSPSTDPQNKVILGGSLTNWPATRNDKGQILLRPVELSQSIKEIDMAKTIEEVMAELETLKTQVAGLSASKPAPKPEPKAEGEVTDEMQEFITSIDGAEELGRQAQELATQRILDEQRKQHVKEFCAAFVGGTKDRPIGLKVRASELAASLLSLPDRQRLFMEKVLTATHDALIDFSEHGINGADFVQGKPFPKEFSENLKLWIASGRTAESWFKEVGQDVGLSDAKDYNLREFAPKDKEA